jgi:hypothetical protein
MPYFPPPAQPQDPFDLAGQLFGSNPQPANGFAADIVPSPGGLGTRQSQIPDNRAAYSRRNLMHWMVPEGPIIQMYINPQNVRYSYKKLISNQRTKGGYVLQYWGEELTILNISGTTGTSGIEGINVLYDLYRNEQVAFDPFALAVAAKAQQDAAAANSADLFGASSALSAGSNFVSSLFGAAQGVGPTAAIQTPTLASLAFTVELYWSGEVYRGYFTEFSVIENAEKLGLFDYEMGFTVTQKRGLRQNFLGWHRSAVSGPSNSNPVYGTPHSFGQLVLGER